MLDLIATCAREPGNITKAGGTWVHTPGVEHGDDHPMRVSGETARKQFIQLDETPVLIGHDNDTGKMKMKKHGGGRGERRIVATSESREHFTVCVWMGGCGRVLLVQVIFKGKGLCEHHLCDGVTEAPVMVQHTESANQTGETLLEACKQVDLRQRAVNNNNPLVVGPGRVTVTSTGGHASR